MCISELWADSLPTSQDPCSAPSLNQFPQLSRPGYLSEPTNGPARAPQLHPLSSSHGPSTVGRPPRHGAHLSFSAHDPIPGQKPTSHLVLNPVWSL